MGNQEIVQKLWNLCNVLRDDGITYHQYVTELTYLLFLKMMKETGKEDDIPEKYRWDSLTKRHGLELKGITNSCCLIWAMRKRDFKTNLRQCQNKYRRTENLENHPLH